MPSNCFWIFQPPNGSIKNEAILLASRNSTNNTDCTSGKINKSDHSAARTNITYSLLQLLDKWRGETELQPQSDLDAVISELPYEQLTIARLSL